MVLLILQKSNHIYVIHLLFIKLPLEKFYESDSFVKNVINFYKQIVK